MAQLDLWQAELDALPWQGRSPRTLTRGHLAFIFKPEAQKRERFLIDPRQLLFELPGNKAPWTYQGVPLLQEEKS